MILQSATGEKSPRPRGRPRRFDYVIALNTIRTCFAKKGYSGTSIEELSEATGISTQSLYNAFGDKRAMYLQALDLEYEEVAARLRRLKAEGPIDLFRAYVEAATTGYAPTDRLPGIAFGAALAGAGDDTEVVSRLRRLLSALDSVAIELLGPTVSPSVAELLSTLAIGLCLRSRSGAHVPEGLGLTSLVRTLAGGTSEPRTEADKATASLA